MSDLEKVLAEVGKDPDLFVRHVLKATPQEWQAEALRAVRDNNKVCIKSGHGVGKSTFLAWLVLWQLLTKYPTKVVATANTAHQLHDILWTEVEKWSRELPDGFRNQLELKQDKISLRGVSDSFCAFRTARKESPESLQGFHSPNMMVLVDEASGVDEQVFIVGEGTMSTPHAKTILTGNPTRTEGFFYEAFHSNREQWHCMTVSCEDSPMVSESFLTDMRQKYGEDSNVWRVRVAGEFPTQSDDVLVPLHLVEAAVKRDIQPSPTTPIVWAVDVARYGQDRSALCKRQGHVVLDPVKTWQGKDIMELAGLLLSEYEVTPYSMRPEAIFVDSIGVGAGLADRLRELDVPAVAVSVSESPAIKAKFMRLRDELFWKAREWFEERSCQIPNDPTLIQELTAIRYKFQSRGKMKVESKDEMKRRGQRSPDVADAFVMTFAQEGALATGSYSKWSSKRSLNQDRGWVV